MARMHFSVLVVTISHLVPNCCAHPLKHTFSRICASNVLAAHRKPVWRSRTRVYLMKSLLYARASPFFSHIMLFMSTFRIFSMRLSWPSLPFLWHSSSWRLLGKMRLVLVIRAAPGVRAAMLASGQLDVLHFSCFRAWRHFVHSRAGTSRLSDRSPSARAEL